MPMLFLTEFPSGFGVMTLDITAGSIQPENTGVSAG
jgi:hypothetical protein